MRTSCSDNIAQNNCDFALPKLQLPKDKESVLVKGLDWSPRPGFLMVVFFCLFIIFFLLL